MISVKDLKSRRSSLLPDNIRKQSKKIIIDGEEPSLSSSSLSEKNIRIRIFREGGRNHG